MSIRVIGAASVVAVVASILTSAGASSATADGRTARTGTRVDRPVAAPGSVRWAARYTSQGRHPDSAISVAVSPRGGAVFVTGTSGRTSSGRDFVTLAYSAGTGKRLWAARYTSRGARPDLASAVTVAPGGKRVYVTGQSLGDYVTVAYSAATGQRLWLQRYRDPAGADKPAALAVSHDGGVLIVTGTASASDIQQHSRALTIAYAAATGRQLWVKRYAGPAGEAAAASSLTISADDGRVYVTGSARWAGGERSDLVIVAYRAATGRQLWATSYRSPCHNGAGAIAASPGGGRVFVTGSGGWCPDIGSYLTAAYGAATGRQLWVRHYTGRARSAEASAIAVSPDGGRRVFVTGTGDLGFSSGAMTVAYNSATGARLWTARYGGTAFFASANAVAVSRDARTVYITGSAEVFSGGEVTRPDYITIAYDAATGTQLWITGYGGPDHGDDYAAASVLRPDGHRIYVTGTSVGSDSGEDFLTVAFDS